MKERLDKLLVDRELVETRSRAAALIMAGQVFVNDVRVEKAGTKVPEDANLEVRGLANPYVSRGGLKLRAALDAFAYSCKDKVVVDVGASTGGFTDCVLQDGAQKVFAIDVGYGQLAWKLRQDERVVNMERVNIRHVDPDTLESLGDLAVIDCSFISLDKVLEPTLRVLRPNADIIALIKPQFEVGKENVGKGGVVRDTDARSRSIDDVVSYAQGLGLEFVQGIDCPVHGPAGNIEFLAWFVRKESK